MCTRRTDVSSHAEHGWVGWREQFAEGVEETSRYIQRDVAKSNLRGCVHGESEIHPTEGRIDALSEHWASGTDVADTSDKRLQGGEEAGNYGTYRPECRHEQPAGLGRVSRGSGEAQSSICGVVDGMADILDADQRFQGWWEVEPQIGRVTTGCENRAAQLKALGNGQVPLQAAVAWKLLGGL